MSADAKSRAPIAVFLADDYKAVRDGLRALLDAQADLGVIGDAGNGRLAVQQAPKLTSSRPRAARHARRSR